LRERRANDAFAQRRAVRGAIAHVQGERRRDLIVAAAPGVKPFARLGFEFAYARVDRAMDVFGVRRSRMCGERAARDLGFDDGERRTQRRRDRRRDYRAVYERGDVRERTAHVEGSQDEIFFE